MCLRGLYKRGPVWWIRFRYKGQQICRSTETEDRKLARRVYDEVRGKIAEGKWFDLSKDYTFRPLMDKWHSRLEQGSCGSVRF